MCYDIAFTTKIESVFKLMPMLKTAPGANLSFETTWHKIGMSYPQWPVVVNHEVPQLAKFTWGPVPKMLDTPEKVKRQRQMFLNARSEKVLEPRTLWNAIRHQRCLIPVTGFFEYREVPGWKSKVPYYIKSREQETFFIAGLWALSNSWDVDKPERIPTFSILTRRANHVMQQIHNGGENAGRMPMMLSNELAESWIKPGLTDTDIRDLLQYEQPSDTLQFWTVNSVRKVKPDDESVIKEIAYDGLPPVTV